MNITNESNQNLEIGNTNYLDEFVKKLRQIVVPTNPYTRQLISILISQIDIAVEREKLTGAQKELLNKCLMDWSVLPVGCTNKTLLALEKKRFVETRLSKQSPPELSKWEWRISRL